MPSTRDLIRPARLFHLYSGLFLAPAILFFAFTGAIQTFSLHETTKGSAYTPPRILVILGQLHKKQTIVVPDRKGPPPETRPAQPTASSPAAQTQSTTASPAATQDRPARDQSNQTDEPKERNRTNNPTDAGQPRERTHNLLPMKIFFLLVALGLFASTLTGIFMAYQFARRKSLITVTLAAGVAVPLLLLLL